MLFAVLVQPLLVNQVDQPHMLVQELRFSITQLNSQDLMLDLNVLFAAVNLKRMINLLS